MRRVLARAAALLLAIMLLGLPQTASAETMYQPVTASVPVGGSGTFLIKHAQDADANAFDSITIDGSGSFSLSFDEPVDYSFEVFSNDAVNTARYNVLVHVVVNQNDILHPVVIVTEADTGRKTPAALYPVTIDPPVTKRVTGEQTPRDETFEFSFKGIGTTAEGLNNIPPMPEGSTGQEKILTIVGSGEVEAGDILIDRAGVYEYEFTEINRHATGYTYDSSVYRLIFTVSETESGFLVEKELRRNDAASDYENALFVNEYRKPHDPQTGDQNHLMFWTATLGFNMAMLALVIVLRRREEND